MERIRCDLQVSVEIYRTRVRPSVRGASATNETLQPASLLQLMPIPTAVCFDILMDYVEALPKVSQKYVILIVAASRSMRTSYQ